MCVLIATLVYVFYICSHIALPCRAIPGLVSATLYTYVFVCVCNYLSHLSMCLCSCIC